MQYLGIRYSIQFPPVLDPEFIPFGIWSEAYRKNAAKPIAIAIERNNGHISVRNTVIYGTEEMTEADYRYVERYVKFLLWSIGGFRVYLCGCPEIAQRLKDAGLPVVDIHQLKEKAEALTGKPARVQRGDKVVAEVISRDGEILDRIYSVVE